MILAPLLEIYSARYTIHGLTNRRLITLMKSKGQSLNSVDFDDMGSISFRQNSDGWGDLTVETGSYQNSKGRQIVQTFKFVGIPEVAKLERLLREAQEAR